MSDNRFYVFGAHSRARTTARYLVEADEGMVFLGYLIDNDEPNEYELGGVCVIDRRMKPYLDTTASVYIGTRGTYFNHAVGVLSKLGFTKIYPVDVKLDTDLRTEFFQKRFRREGRAFIKIDDLKSHIEETEGIFAVKKTDSETASSNEESRDIRACIFEVRSVYDKPLVEDTYVRAPCEEAIQVGAALTDIRLESCKYRDNEGDHISEMNRRLCELTALYWMWKNTSFDIVGLVHYRRHFLMPDRWTERMMNNGVDIIVPIPLYIEPSVEENYRFRHISSDWDDMLNFMRNNHADQMETTNKCFSDTYYYPCNMFVMKREIFEEYCSWLFPILFYVMDKAGGREDEYQNRYPAFLAERLLTLFCYINRDRYRIVFADKNFLE